MPTNSRQKGPIAGSIYTPSDKELCRFTIPVRVKNMMNSSHVAWYLIRKYAKPIREAARNFANSKLLDCDKLHERYRVTLIRQSTTAKRMDGDGLQAAMKPVRDGIADALGIDDGSDRIEWKYEQEKTGEYAVEVKIERMA